MRYVLCAVVALSLAAGPASAQSVDTKALAEQLFNQARDLVKAERWEEACPKFEASLRYDPVLGTKLNLATCYERTGKLASAWGLYRDSIELAKKAGDAKRADYAQKQASALEPRLPTLRIALPENPPPAMKVERDGIAMDAGAFGVALYVDPGAHQVVASAPGFIAFKQSITVVEGKPETLAIPSLVAEPVTPPAGEEPDAEAKPGLDMVKATTPTPPPSRTRKYLGLGLGAAGLAAMGTGVVFGMKAQSTNDEAKELCGSDLVCDTASYGKGKELVADARSQATLSTALVIGGGAAIIAGAVVYLTAPRARERTTARLVPTTHDRGAGVAVVGRF